MFKKTLSLAIASTFLLSACAPFNERYAIDNKIEKAVDEQANKKSTYDENFMVSKTTPYLDLEKVPVKKGNVDLKLNNIAVGDALNSVVKKYNYNIVFMDNIDPAKKVSVNYSGTDYETAIRHIAFSAGYVAAFDKRNRTVYISNEGTYTFRIPTAVMSEINSTIQVGGNPAKIGSSGSGGGGGGGSSGLGQAMTSEFKISADSHKLTKTFENHLKNVAGSNSEVSISPEIGLVTVRANGQALMRIKSFLDSVIEDAMARVEIQAAIVEVSLTGDMAYGIKWDQILNDSANTHSNFGFDGSSMVNGGSTSLTMTTASTNAILTALSKKTGLSVISQPKLITMNHTSALLFDGTQIPYLGTASNGAASTTGMTTGPTGSVSYTVDGLSLSILPDIINNTEVAVSIVPVISSVTGMSNFALGSATLTAPNQKVKQSFADILTQSGKTTILAGSRYKNETGNRSEIPGLGSIPIIGNLFASESNNNSDRELVIMIRTNVIPYHGEAQIIQESI